MKKLNLAHVLLLSVISIALLTGGNIIWSQEAHKPAPAESKETKHESAAETTHEKQAEGESKESESAEPTVKHKTDGVGLDMQVMSFKTIAELHSYMKTISLSLGVQCKYCHDLTAFEKNLPILKKNAARKMMTMTEEINQKFFVNQAKKISCFVCHQGRQEPVLSKEELDKARKDEDTNKEKVF